MNEKNVTVSLAELCMRHRKRGREDVVEWIEEHYYDIALAISDLHGYFIEVEELQAKLKEWEIDG